MPCEGSDARQAPQRKLPEAVFGLFVFPDILAVVTRTTFARWRAAAQDLAGAHWPVTLCHDASDPKSFRLRDLCAVGVLFVLTRACDAGSYLTRCLIENEASDIYYRLAKCSTPHPCRYRCARRRANYPQKQTISTKATASLQQS